MSVPLVRQKHVWVDVLIVRAGGDRSVAARTAP